jgi:integrase
MSTRRHSVQNLDPQSPRPGRSLPDRPMSLGRGVPAYQPPVARWRHQSTERSCDEWWGVQAVRVPDPETGRSIDTTCQRLSERGHGSWYFDCAVAALPGRRERLRRGGYVTRREAVAARDVVLGRGDAATVEAWTVGRWLRYWLGTRTGIRPTTLRSYTEHVERHLVPHPGRIGLGELTGRQVADMIATIAATPTRYGHLRTPSTLHRIRATLRSALNAAIRDGLLRDNPASHVEVPSPRRPQAQVWTDQRVQQWRQTGQRFAVAVWTAPQLAGFLRYVGEDRLYAMWWLIALRGLRRGEAAGLRWVDVDLDARVVMIGQQLLAYGATVAVGPPKTAASRRTIALDRHTVRLLRAHRRRQLVEQVRAGERWQDSGFMFTTPDGAALHPDYLTRRFAHLVNLSGLPPVRLHDLRHGAASLAHATGADLKTVQEQLGHSSIVLTADTYTSVLHELHIKTAEATVRLVLAAAVRAPGQHHRKPARKPARTGPPETARPQPTGPPKAKRHKRSGTVNSRRHGAHTRPTEAPQRSKPHSPKTIRPAQARCAARDSNPEPAD